MALTAPPQQKDDKKAAPTKEVEFEGTIHEFPADFTDDDIKKALSSVPKTETNPTTGITTPAGSTGSDDDSILGGMARRLGQTVSGAYHTFTDPATEEEIARRPGMKDAGAVTRGLTRMGTGFVETEKEAARQTGEALKEGGAAGYARAAVTGASMLDPFATGTVTDINRLRDEGRQKEAIGAGAFDVLALLAGSKMGKITPESQVSRLTAAIGKTGETTANLKEVMPEIAETARVKGTPTTVGALRDNLDTTLTRLNDTYKRALWPVRQQQQMPVDISRALRAKITPNLLKTAEGRAEALALRKAALEFERPWSLGELDDERMRRNASTSSLYNKSSGGASTAVKSNVDMMIDKIVADGARSTIDKVLDRLYPGSDTAGHRNMEKALWHLRDQLDSRIGDLEDAQAEKEGQTMSQKVKPGISVGAAGRPHGYIGSLGKLLPGGPLEDANTNVRRGFNVSGPAKARRAAVLSLPVDHALVSPPKSKLTPPPSQANDE